MVARPEIQGTANGRIGRNSHPLSGLFAHFRCPAVSGKKFPTVLTRVMSLSALHRIEHGQRSVTLSEIAALANTLQIAPSELIRLPLRRDPALRS